MAFRYKLVQRRNPQDPEGPKKWYATPNSSTPLNERDMVKEATKNTTMAPSEFRSAMELLTDFIPTELKQSHTSKVPGLGTFRLTFKSEGADTVEEFDANSMISSPRVVFTLDAEFREKVLRNLTFEDGGVLEDGISYASRDDYYEKKRKEAESAGGQ